MLILMSFLTLFFGSSTLEMPSSEPYTTAATGTKPPPPPPPTCHCQPIGHKSW